MCNQARDLMLGGSSEMMWRGEMGKPDKLDESKGREGSVAHPAPRIASIKRRNGTRSKPARLVEV